MPIFIPALAAAGIAAGLGGAATRSREEYQRQGIGGSTMDFLGDLASGTGDFVDRAWSGTNNPQSQSSGTRNTRPYDFTNEAVNGDVLNMQRNKTAMNALREWVADNPPLTNQQVTRRARNQVMPIFQPQIRSTKRSIRQTKRQGRQAANQVRGYYRQAGQEVQNLGQGNRRATKQAMKQMNSGGMKGGGNNANRESQISADAIRGSGKASSAFFKKLQGSLAGEGAVAAADTRRNYQDLANEYRTDLADLRSQRATMIQQAKKDIRNNVQNTTDDLYEDFYLKQIEAGNSPRKAMRASLALAPGNRNGAVKRQLASQILSNRGNEQALLDAMALKPQTADEIEQEQNSQKLYNDQLKTMLDGMKDMSDEDVRKYLKAMILSQQTG